MQKKESFIKMLANLDLRKLMLCCLSLLTTIFLWSFYSYEIVRSGQTSFTTILFFTGILSTIVLITTIVYYLVQNLRCKQLSEALNYKYEQFSQSNRDDFNLPADDTEIGRDYYPNNSIDIQTAMRVAGQTWEQGHFFGSTIDAHSKSILHYLGFIERCGNWEKNPAIKQISLSNTPSIIFHLIKL
ncbi:MAG: hypothetical protein GY874_08190 [Desulfobacteraceae bacterium]|nr:hypothetical protein [Desulfobacteraceae bacterium]